MHNMLCAYNFGRVTDIGQGYIEATEHFQVPRFGGRSSGLAWTGETTLEERGHENNALDVLSTLCYISVQALLM
jgi:hypothetical protein